MGLAASETCIVGSLCRRIQEAGLGRFDLKGHPFGLQRMLARAERNQLGKLLLFMTLDVVGVGREWGQPQQLIVRQRPLLVLNAKPLGVMVASHDVRAPCAERTVRSDRQ
jgi:hypothetical protein